MEEQKPKIAISKELKEKLDKLGCKGDTYEDVILRLIKQSDKI